MLGQFLESPLTWVTKEKNNSVVCKFRHSIYGKCFYQSFLWKPFSHLFFLLYVQSTLIFLYACNDEIASLFSFFCEVKLWLLGKPNTNLGFCGIFAFNVSTNKSNSSYIRSLDRSAADAKISLCPSSGLGISRRHAKGGKLEQGLSVPVDRRMRLKLTIEYKEYRSAIRSAGATLKHCFEVYVICNTWLDRFR